MQDFPSFLLKRVFYVLWLMFISINSMSNWKELGSCQYSLNYHFKLYYIIITFISPQNMREQFLAQIMKLFWKRLCTGTLPYIGRRGRYSCSNVDGFFLSFGKIIGIFKVIDENIPRASCAMTLYADRNLFGKHSFEIARILRLWSFVSKRSFVGKYVTHLDDSFHIPKISFIIETSEPRDLPIPFTFLH